MTPTEELEQKEFNQYKSSAAFYDLDFTGTSYEDVEFYLGLVKPFYTEVLELCSGTGRISIPLAQNNIKVSALDISKEMLSIFNDKLKYLSKEISDRITLIESDMVNFSLNRKFNCILIPFHSFQSLTDTLQISQALQTISRHLTDDGIFILNIFKPLDNMKIIEGVCETKVVANDKGEPLYEKKCCNTFVDTINQILFYELQYYPSDKDDCITEHLKAKYYSADQIIELLHRHNFNIETLYHGFNKNISDKSDSTELTIVCKKKTE